jgi:hypothetical protein
MLQTWMKFLVLAWTVCIVATQDAYVSPEGDDASGDGTIANPFQTIAHAATTGVETIILMKGIHSEDGNTNISFTGASTVSKITGLGAPLETIILGGVNTTTFTITAHTMEFSNFALHGGSKAIVADDSVITLQNMIIERQTTKGFRSRNSGKTFPHTLIAHTTFFRCNHQQLRFSQQLCHYSGRRFRRREWNISHHQF